MAQTISSKLNVKRGLFSFLAGYIGVSPFAFGLYVIIAYSMGSSPFLAVDVKDNEALMIAHKFWPIINLCVWTAAAWIYFRRPANVSYANAAKLSVFWLVIAALADFVGFVLIQHPLSADVNGFYVGQFPWIYFTYAAVAASPFAYVALKNRRKA